VTLNRQSNFYMLTDLSVRNYEKDCEIKDEMFKNKK
jgi:hypothetical protein